MLCKCWGGHVPQRWAKAARVLVKIIRSSRSLKNLGPLYQPPAANKGMRAVTRGAPQRPTARLPVPACLLPYTELLPLCSSVPLPAGCSSAAPPLPAEPISPAPGQQLMGQHCWDGAAGLVPAVGTADVDRPWKAWFTQAQTRCRTAFGIAFPPRYRAYSPRAGRGLRCQGPPPPAAAWALQGEQRLSITTLLVPSSPCSPRSPTALPAQHGAGTAGAQPSWVALTARVGHSQLFLHAGQARVPKGGLVSSHGAVPLAVALLGNPPQGIRSQALCRDMGHGPTGRPAPARQAPASCGQGAQVQPNCICVPCSLQGSCAISGSN